MRLAAALSIAWRGRAGTAPASARTNGASAANGWSCLRRSRPVVLRDSELGSGASQFAVIQAVAPSLRLEVNPVNVGGTAEIERAVAAFARAPNGGLIATGGGRVRFHRT